MSVKRYEYRHGELSDEHYNHPPAGEFVRWEDYAALLARYTLAIEQHELLKTSVKMYENRVEGGDLNREKNETIKRLKAATQWRSIETATWDVLSKNDRVVLNGWNGSVRFANVVDVAGQLGFDDEYGVPLMAVYDGYTHWMPLPKPPCV